MSGDHHSALQDAFLNQARQQRVSVTIFLVNGVKLQGIITWFDAYCILLKRDHLSQLVFKHAVSTVMPMAPITVAQVEELAESEGKGS